MAVVSQNKIKSITRELEQLIRSTSVEATRIEDFYVFSYQHLRVGDARRVAVGCWKVEEVTRRLTTVYGWMPCSPKSHSAAALGELAERLNKKACLELLMPVASRCLSNSLVAASKFVHWEFPDTAPMFDSTLEARYWPETNSRLSYLPTAVRRYLEWAAAIQAVAPELQARAREWALAAFGYEVSEVRAVEALAFYATGDSVRPRPTHYPRAA